MADERPSVSIKWDGKIYELDFDDVNGLERRAFRQTVGVPIETLPMANLTGRLDPVEVAAGVIWLLKRRDDHSLSYDSVLAGITPDTLETVGEDEQSPPD